MIKCMNKVCEFYKQQFEEGVELCPSCGEHLVKDQRKINSNLALASTIAGVASILIFWGFNLYAGYIIAAASIVFAFISKSVPTIVVTIASLAVIVLLTLSFTL
ncbi:MAG: hypothetical protein AB9835_12160 [Eubacteriales bacterium]